MAHLACEATSLQSERRAIDSGRDDIGVAAGNGIWADASGDLVAGGCVGTQVDCLRCRGVERDRSIRPAPPRPAPLTFRLSWAEAPLLSKMTMVALPELAAVTERLSEPAATAATFGLLDTAVYGPVPPVILYCVVLLGASVTADGAATASVCPGAVGTVTLITTLAPPVSVTFTMAVPPANPASVGFVPPMLAVTTKGLLLDAL